MEQTKKFLSFSATRIWETILEQLEFLGGSANMVYASIRGLFSRPFYFGLFVEQCFILGFKSLSIVLITAVSTGFVMSIQFGYGLERFGGKLYVPKVVGLSILRELGPVLSCLMLAGRVGSGIAAEIGSMNVTQQIDAIRALGTDPIKRIVIPRILAMLLMAPLLTAMADLLGIVGGMVISSTELYIHPDYYFHQALISLRSSDFLVGIVKTIFFGFFIAVTGCYYGLRTTGGTQGVGHSTTKAVVTSSVLIVIFDFVLTKLFWIWEKGIQ